MLRHRLLRHHRLFHHPPSESPFQKGDMKYVILDLLKDGPKYGYEIIHVLENQSHGFYRPSPGAVYPTLQMLEEMGYASSTERDGKKIYAITDEGIKFLEECSDFTNEIRNHMCHHWNTKNLGAIGGLIDEFADIVESLVPRINKESLEKIERINQVVKKARKDMESILNE